MAKRRPALERFHEQYVTDAVTECMIWTSARNHKGYGHFRDGATRIVHRWSYEQFVGPIPEGLVLDHVCRNRGCVNPEHLRPCTPAENTHAPGSEAIAAMWARRTHCKNGHPFDESNTSLREGRWRVCKMCERDRSRIRQGFKGSLGSRTLPN